MFFILENVLCNPKLLAHDTPLFSEVPNEKVSLNDLNNDLNKIRHWAYQ